MKKLIIILFFLLVSLFACNLHEQVVDVRDVAKEENLILKKEKGQEHIHRLDIKIVGELDGDAEMSLMLNGKVYETAELSGMFDLKMYGGDWYSDSAELIYEPLNAKSGKVTIVYKFFDQ